MMDICAFTKSSLPFGILGNMSRCRIEAFDKEWTSSEALFQAMRFEDPSIREQCRIASNGFTAKLVAKKFADLMVVEKCSAIDVENMRLCLKWKFEQNEDVRNELWNTRHATIIEDVTARGVKGTNLFWGMLKTECSFVGIDGWVGENKLGELWMKLRDSSRGYDD